MEFPMSNPVPASLTFKGKDELSEFCRIRTSNRDDASKLYKLLLPIAFNRKWFNEVIKPLNEAATKDPKLSESWCASTDLRKESHVYPHIAAHPRCIALATRLNVPPEFAARVIYKAAFPQMIDFMTFQKLAENRQLMTWLIENSEVTDGHFDRAHAICLAEEEKAACIRSRDRLELRARFDELDASLIARDNEKRRLIQLRSEADAAAVHLAKEVAARIALEERLAASEAAAAVRLAEMEAARTAAEERARLAEEGRVRDSAVQGLRNQHIAVLLQEISEPFGARPAIYAAPPPLLPSPEEVWATNLIERFCKNPYKTVEEEATLYGYDSQEWVKAYTSARRRASNGQHEIFCMPCGTHIDLSQYE